ncbi:transposase [Streptomyces nigrescens]
MGIGLDTAVTLLITMGDIPERLHSEASFAALCGVGQPRRTLLGHSAVPRLKRYAAREVFHLVRPVQTCSPS